MATAPKMKPAKAAEKLNRAPDLLGTPKGEAGHEGAPQKLSENNRNGKSLEAAGFQQPESIQVGGNQFVVLRPNRIVFVPVHGGWTAAQRGFSKGQLLRTYESIERNLAIVKIAVGQNKGEVTASELRESFRDSYLYKATGPSDWGDFLDDFRPAPHRMSTPREVALRFLARTTDLGRGVIEKYCSQARNSRK